ncbi:MAG: GNAT family N-acetyltransferase [Bacteroidia bacterium]
MSIINLSEIKIVEVDLLNLENEGIFCIKDKKSIGYKQKLKWYQSEYKRGLRIFIAKDSSAKQIGFIEAIPSEYAWRPIYAPDFMFIQCLVIFSKEFRGLNIASELIKAVEDYSRASKKKGICVLSSNGPWMANSTVFLKNGFTHIESKDRFELNVKSFIKLKSEAKILDFINKQKDYPNWHLLYSDQCPWHDKSAKDLQAYANEIGIKLEVTKIDYLEAQNGPSGFGTFSLLHNGKLLADHYISKTRFISIVKKELKF